VLLILSYPGKFTGVIIIADVKQGAATVSLVVRCVVDKALVTLARKPSSSRLLKSTSKYLTSFVNGIQVLGLVRKLSSKYGEREREGVRLSPVKHLKHGTPAVHSAKRQGWPSGRIRLRGRFSNIHGSCEKDRGTHCATSTS
jgi:hypothetical protein